MFRREILYLAALGTCCALLLLARLSLGGSRGWHAIGYPNAWSLAVWLRFKDAEAKEAAGGGVTFTG